MESRQGYAHGAERIACPRKAGTSSRSASTLTDRLPLDKKNLNFFGTGAISGIASRVRGPETVQGGAMAVQVGGHVTMDVSAFGTANVT